MRVDFLGVVSSDLIPLIYMFSDVRHYSLGSYASDIRAPVFWAHLDHTWTCIEHLFRFIRLEYSRTTYSLSIVCVCCRKNDKFDCKAVVPAAVSWRSRLWQRQRRLRPFRKRRGRRAGRVEAEAEAYANFAPPRRPTCACVHQHAWYPSPGLLHHLSSVPSQDSHDALDEIASPFAPGPTTILHSWSNIYGRERLSIHNMVRP